MPDKSRVTQNDVAKALGISRALVSITLNNRPDGFGNVTVRPELREEIRKKAMEMGYRPNRAARALLNSSSRTIGIISPSSEYQVSNRTASALTSLVQRNGYTAMPQIIEMRQGIPMLKETAHILADYRVDGVLLHMLENLRNKSASEQIFKSLRCPVVQVSFSVSSDFPSVTVDYYGGGRDIARSILATGRRRILGVCFYHMSSAVEERFQGAEDACAEVDGASFEVFRVPGRPYDHNPNILESGYLLTKEFLKAHRPDAVFYSNDLLACGGLNALAEVGIKVPDDIAVCGFDGMDISGYTIPSLTTVVQPVKECARTAVNMLFKMLAEPDYTPPAVTRLPCHLELRRSTEGISCK